MKRIALFGIALTLVLGVLALAGPPMLAWADEILAVEIQVSPNTIQLGDSQPVWVTIHTDLPYGLVDTDLDITLNGVLVNYTKSDLCGDLVAKFNSSEIKDIVEPGMVTLTLRGVTVYGQLFEGSSTVRVVACAGAQKK
jgi:hypothetical protein